MSTEERVDPQAHALLRAKFVAQAVVEHGVSVGIVPSPAGLSVFVWAPTARTRQRQEDCELSFHDAIAGLLRRRG
jgi:hypothetical protein